MKSYLYFILLFYSMILSAQIRNQITENFTVKGNCGECKERIEAAVNQENVAEGKYNIDSQILALTYNKLLTSPEKVLQKVAAVGHDNQLFQAEDVVYNALPACCMYDRVSKTANEAIDAETVTIPTEFSIVFPNQKLETVVIKGKKDATKLSNLASTTFNIDKTELLKAACCNLSESFETNATVDVSISNAVTGTKQLKMLGLDQKYSLLTKENMPDIRGLGASLGLNFIPGRWISSIQLTKGGSSVVNGYEAITGQINAEMIKYQEPEEETTFNFFANNNSRLEFNATQTKEYSEQMSNSMLFHASGIANKVDQNKDGFLDNPLSKQINFMDIFKYRSETGLEGMTGANLLYDKRVGGQTHFDESKDLMTQNAYGTKLETNRLQLWNKTGYVFKNKPGTSMGLQTQWVNHNHNSYFGQRTYNGTEQSFYANYIFESILQDTNHKYKLGASYLYDNYHETYNDLTFNKTEKVPGVFAEYTYNYLNKLTIVGGFRSDFHNLAGTQFTPRLNIRYEMLPKTTLRLSAGKGFRMANILNENLQYFASNRTVEVNFNPISTTILLKPEQAWNYGLSLAKDFKLFYKKSSVVIDFFKTDFQQQVVVDLDNAREIQFYNLNGKSFANSLQMQWDVEPLKNLQIRMAYKYYDVKMQYIYGINQLPFTPSNRGFLNLAYHTIENTNEANWDFDFTIQYVGQQRLPNTSLNSTANRKLDYANAYTVLNAQMGRKFNANLRIYLGLENLGSYTQKNPIIEAQNPFGTEFDATMVYAPIMGANLYLGIDWKL
jgi:outer membrane receptor for ferrienterochelin and colicins